MHNATRLPVAVLAALTLLGGGVAEAAVTDVKPVRVSVNTQVESFKTTAVTTTHTANGLHGASMWMIYRDPAHYDLVGAGVSRTKRVTLRARVETTKLGRWGLQDALIEDDLDGGTRTLKLDIRRAGAAGFRARAATGGVKVHAVLKRYEPAAGRFVPAAGVQGYIEMLTRGHWVMKARFLTGRRGASEVRVPARRGRHTYRIRTYSGPGVWGAISKSHVGRAN